MLCGKILVAHPGLQHSYQLAEALYEIDSLGLYISGTPLKNHADIWGSVFIPKKIEAKIRSTSIPLNLRQHNISWHIARLIANKLPINNFEFNYRMFHMFDAWIASRISKLRPSIVVGYDNSCARTFEVAKSLGIKCILDAPSVHYEYAKEDVFLKKSIKYRDSIKKQKLQEVSLADQIIVCSNFAASTYEANGVEPNRLKVIHLGSEPPLSLQRIRRHKKDELRFVFAGTMSFRKSTDILLAVFRELGSVAQLTIVGGSESKQWIDECNSLPNVSYLGHKPQSELYEIIAESDCLILPSRFDAFGMVVVEALSVGTPVIVSENVGAKEVVEMFPGAGIITPVNACAIKDTIKKLVSSPTKLENMNDAAYQSGAYFSWRRYRKRVSEFVSDLS